MCLRLKFCTHQRVCVLNFSKKKSNSFYPTIQSLLVWKESIFFIWPFINQGRARFLIWHYRRMRQTWLCAFSYSAKAFCLKGCKLHFLSAPSSFFKWPKRYDKRALLWNCAELSSHILHKLGSREACLRGVRCAISIRDALLLRRSSSLTLLVFYSRAL
jgi:hypothetical protein